MDSSKYKRAYFPVPPIERKWTSNTIDKPPVWCSVDLRDGNQALFSPMTLEEKVEFFKLLVDVGFKEIEVGFPAASDTEYDFVRYLIDNNLIPDDVTIQVLTQAREHIIRRTVASLEGAKNAIIHFYNSTSMVQRELVFKKSKEEIIELAVDGAKLIKSLTDDKKNIRYEYSPESFTCTEMEYALQICNAVIDVLEPTPDRKLIINLPSTIEVATANVYADQIEYMHTNMKNRENLIISIHAHNDRGTGVAASELALLAGADRVEGTLFGNGERTGNADIITIALNMLVTGVDPKLNVERIDALSEAYERFNKLPLSPRHPYVGELAYTAFSGSHQDAIKKSMDYANDNNTTLWQNPYLTIDPTDLEREYEPIRINSQSGKGGLKYVLENKFGYRAPKNMLAKFIPIVKHESEIKNGVVSPEEIIAMFRKTFIHIADKIILEDYDLSLRNNTATVVARVEVNGVSKKTMAEGNGPLDAFTKVLQEVTGREFALTSYSEHDLGGNSTSSAVSYISIRDKDGNEHWGAGVDSNINTSSFFALISAVSSIL